MTRIPAWLRMAGLAIGAALLVWAPFEDVGIRGVLLLSTAICAWFCVRLLINLSPQMSRRIFLGCHLSMGMLAGLAVAPLGFLLMAFKSGLHGHGDPDFAPEQIRALLSLAPYLAASGLLIGLGCGLWRSSVREAA